MSYVALKPVNPTNDLVIIWHMLDEPSNPAAMAEALPLSGVDAWRIYLPLPMPAGEPDFSDVVQNIFGPITTEAAAQLPGQLASIRKELGLGIGRVSLVGGSLGALVALRAASEVPADAIALVVPAVQLSALVAVNEQAFGMTYQWSPASTELADRLDFVAHAATIKQPILLVTGGNDPLAASAEQLWKARPDNTSLVSVPGMAHEITPEVDPIVTSWLLRQLG